MFRCIATAQHKCECMTPTRHSVWLRLGHMPQVVQPPACSGACMGPWGQSVHAHLTQHCTSTLLHTGERKQASRHMFSAGTSHAPVMLTRSASHPGVCVVVAHLAIRPCACACCIAHHCRHLSLACMQGAGSKGRRRYPGALMHMHIPACHLDACCKVAVVVWPCALMHQAPAARTGCSAACKVPFVET